MCSVNKKLKNAIKTKLNSQASLFCNKFQGLLFEHFLLLPGHSHFLQNDVWKFFETDGAYIIDREMLMREITIKVSYPHCHGSIVMKQTDRQNYLCCHCNLHQRANPNQSLQKFFQKKITTQKECAAAILICNINTKKLYAKPNFLNDHKILGRLYLSLLLIFG